MPEILTRISLGRRRSGGSQFEVSPGKKFTRLYLNLYEKLNVVTHACHPSYMGSVNRIVVQASPGINAKLYLKNN
jgi:hypothetical protein